MFSQNYNSLPFLLLCFRIFKLLYIQHLIFKITRWDSWASLVSQFSHSVMSNSLQPHGLHHARPPCPSPTPGVYPNSCPLSQWCHPTISSSVVPFSSRLQSFPASGSFQTSQFFISGGQSIGTSASASVLPMSIQDWYALGFLKKWEYQTTWPASWEICM